MTVLADITLKGGWVQVFSQTNVLQLNSEEEVHDMIIQTS